VKRTAKLLALAAWTYAVAHIAYWTGIEDAAQDVVPDIEP
jgi:hypothetical protein